MTAVFNNISTRLKIARLASGHSTFKDFSEKHNIPTSTYWQHENGKRALTVEHLVNYAELVNVDPAWLLTGQGQPCGLEGDHKIEQKIYEEMEKLGIQQAADSDNLPTMSLKNKYAMINLELFKEIFNELMPLIKNLSEDKKSDIFDYCIDLYNQLILTASNEAERRKIIKLCLNSFASGLDLVKETAVLA